MSAVSFTLIPIGRADIGATLVLVLSMPAVVAVANALANYLKSRSSSQPQKVEIKSSSGNTLEVEIKEHMNKEEAEKLVERLNEFARETRNT
jgi:membrane protein YdbS with pleckstrin-like domain